jgi:hypothetical protein
LRGQKANVDTCDLLIAKSDELRHSRGVRVFAAASFSVVLVLHLGCRGPEKGSGEEKSSVGEPDAQVEIGAQVGSCPTDPVEVARSPDVEAKHERVEFWVAKLAAEELADQPLLSEAEVRAINERSLTIDGAWRDPLDPKLADPERVRVQLQERVDWMRGQIVSGNYQESAPGDFERATTRSASAEARDELRIVVEESALRCMPLDASLFKAPVDEAFDRNNCASLHAGEWVRVLKHLSDGESRWDYVHAGHSVGWIRDAQLSPPLAAERAGELRTGPSMVTVRDEARTEGGRSFRMGVRLPVASEGKVLVPTVDGLVVDALAAVDGELPALRLGSGASRLTRQGAWTAAFRELGSPYGWGGRDGERDCSRLLRDVFALSGLELARHSAVQAKVGSELIDVSLLEESAKRERIEQAARQGLVLLYMPGHIMLYLGQDGAKQYAVSSISEFLTPCEGGEDTINRIDRVAVTTLELGRGTRKRSFIERITTLVVFGPPEADEPGREG